MATPVLGLKTFTASDPVDYNEINDNYNKIDSGVKTALQGRAAHNLLDNSDFRNPVNQRGKTSYSALGYTIDRWRTWDDGAVTINNGYISHETPIYQTIAVKLDTSKAYTLAVMNTDNVVTLVSGFINNDLWGSGINLTYNNGDSYVRIYADDHVKNIVWAALYEGSYTADTLPAYVPKGYAAELAECQRYYIIARRYRPAVATFYDSTQSLMIFDVQLPQRMRIKPTATIKEYPSYIRINGQQYSFTDVVISATYYNKNENTIGIVLKCSSNFGSFMTGHFDEIAIEFSSEM